MLPHFVDLDNRATAQLIEGLLDCATKYAVSHAMPADSSCWEVIGLARDYLHRAAPELKDSVADLPVRSAWPELHEEIMAGLQEGQFSVSYQPVCEIGSHTTVVGVEALARWSHPVRGDVPPSIFIPAAEHAGCIHALGSWILLQGCKQIVEWDRLGMLIPSLAVNVSPLQLNREEFLSELDEVLCATGLAPSRLVIEVTESLSLTHNGHAVAKLFRELRARGVRVMIDDFGTGFSSLSYLQRLPFSGIKVDRDFVTKLPTSRNDREIIKAIVGLARRLGMDVIAEGVETLEQMEALKGLGCNHIQGWLVSPALPAAELERSFVERRLPTKQPLGLIAA